MTRAQISRLLDYH